MKTVEKSRKLNVDANLGTTIFKKNVQLKKECPFVCYVFDAMFSL